MDPRTASRPAARFRIPRDVWIGLAALGLAALYWAGTRQIPVSPLDGVVNATAMPRALALAMALFSLLLIARALLVEWMTVRAAGEAGAAGEPVAPVEEDGRRLAWRRHAKALGVLLIGLAYLLLLPWLGYLPSLVLLVGAVSVYIGARPSLYTVGVALAVAVTFWLLFVWLLGIPMPPGIWPGLLP